jgi:acetolactate synthase-1/2/3 large subunit
VVLVVPDDVLTERATAGVARAPRVAVPAITPGDRDVLHAELRRARRPVLIVGGPGWDEAVGRQVTAYAERRSVPVVAAFRWQDAVDNRSLAYAGYLGLGGSPRLREYLDQSDLVVAFGPRLDDPTTDGYRLTENAARVLLISQDAGELCRGPVPDIALHCSLASAAAVLDEMGALGEKDGPVPAGRPEWARALRAEQERTRIPPDSARPAGAWVDLAAVVRHVREVVPDDTIITNGAGNYTSWVQRFFEFRQPGTQVAPRNGAMGYGLPAGLAAAALYPDRKVVTFDGDGCLLMSGSELATAVQYGLRVVVIVVNNAMFGTIRMHQERAYPGRVIATGLRNPDFAAYARSFGALGLLVERTTDFPAAFAAALCHDGPALIEVRTDPALLTPDMRLSAPGER